MGFRLITNSRPFRTAGVRSRSGRFDRYFSKPQHSGRREYPPSFSRFYSSRLLEEFNSNRKTFTTTTTPKQQPTTQSIADTPLGSESHLLSGLDVYEVRADDGHPLSVYGINSKFTDDEDDNDVTKRKPILLLHGRTWSSVPVYHLLGGENGPAHGHNSRSLMEAMYSAGLQPYCMDFRGFGGTPMDATKAVIPLLCVKDVESVMEFIANRHGGVCSIDDDGGPSSSSTSESFMPALLGWSQGALVAQLAAQKRPEMISKLILYGSIYDPLINYRREALYSQDKIFSDSNGQNDEGAKNMRKNTFDSAIEDFTVEGSIPPEPAILFAEAALQADPYTAEWKYLCQFNNLDPAQVHVPTLVVAGDKDPYAPLRVQADLYTNLARGVDRTWSIIADADHAVHLLDGRLRFINIVNSFVENNKQGEYDNCGQK